MQILRAFISAAAIGLVVNACASNESPAPSSEEVEHLGTISQALTTACTFDTIGLPCDPDGPLQPLTECQGACSIATTGLVACTRITQLNIPNLDGRVCGTLDAVGDPACKRFCQGISCLGANAPAGAACRLNALGNPCEGRCDGAGNCEAVAQPCQFGRQDALCKFDTCDLADTSVCRTGNLRSGTLCSQLDACRVGTCTNAGVCNLNNDVACNDSNPCTDDVCDPQSGGCISTPDDSNSCSDGNACTTGDSCAGSACQPGTGTPDCDDDNPCTIDSCDVLVGCVHVPVVCNDGNACTIDSCDPNSGACSGTPTACDDSNPCTIDSCDAATGCSSVPLVCSDADPCTTDTCQLGTCVFSPIADCGAGGAGGAGAGGAGGPGGAGGQSGSDTGGDAGAPAGGADGDGGESSGGVGGEPTAEGGAGGDRPGAGGESGNSSAGADSPPAGGAGTGEAGGPTGGLAGASAGGSVGRAGSSNRNVVEGGGCSCRTTSRGNSSAGFFGILALLALRRRRQQRAA